MKDEVAKILIDLHFKIEPYVREIYRMISPHEDLPEEPIKLLEISESTLETGRVDTFAFRPVDEITYPSIIAEVTPREMQLIREGVIPLPKGWCLETAQCFSRPKELSRAA